jgi:hypothetical protein
VDQLRSVKLLGRSFFSCADDSSERSYVRANHFYGRFDMTRVFKISAAAAVLAVGAFGGASVQAQQQQGQSSAIGTAQVRTREGAPAIQLTNQQTPLITVTFGPQQQSGLEVTALVSTPDQPQQDKEIVFNNAAAQHRIVAFEGDATGSQNRRLTIVAQRGQDNAIIEPIAQNEAVQVFGIRKAEPKVAQQPQQQQPQQGAQAQPGQPQPAAAQQPPQQTPEQAAAAQKQAAEDAKRKAAEPKPDKYDAIVTVFLTTGR